MRLVIGFLVLLLANSVTETAFFKKNANLVPEEMQLMLDQLD